MLTTEKNERKRLTDLGQEVHFDFPENYITKKYGDTLY